MKRRGACIFGTAALALLALACAWRRADSLSPGEIDPRDAPWYAMGGDKNPAERAIAAVVDRKGRLLLGRCVRPPNSKPSLLKEPPSGGEAPFGPLECEALLQMASLTSRTPPLALFAAGVRPTKGEDALSIAQSNNIGARVIDTSTETYYGLTWTLPGGERQGDESAWETAKRFIERECGAPGNALEVEYSYLDADRRTAYFRARYTGESYDVFMPRDRANAEGVRHEEALWFDQRTAEAHLIFAYLIALDGLDKQAAVKLFGLKTK
ncbi:MAG: hypothetical protein BWZ10_01523 [candidate division BRC1 bacterium ADurb.BinA364]|nr:MAG: hypothetical protein BWZ10_01523 [candidate division BRC1 bacterium ADurb.BinA364]